LPNSDVVAYDRTASRGRVHFLLSPFSDRLAEAPGDIEILRPRDDDVPTDNVPSRLRKARGQHRAKWQTSSRIEFFTESIREERIDWQSQRGGAWRRWVGLVRLGFLAAGVCSNKEQKMEGAQGDDPLDTENS
jgi:hypothetical protein